MSGAMSAGLSITTSFELVSSMLAICRSIVCGRRGSGTVVNLAEADVMAQWGKSGYASPITYVCFAFGNRANVCNSEVTPAPHVTRKSFPFNLKKRAIASSRRPSPQGSRTK
jgi:hypothetical protein